MPIREDVGAGVKDPKKMAPFKNCRSSKPTKMPAIRFLHTSDLHLGKRFGRYPEEVRAELQQARQSVLGRIATVAQAQQVGHVLIAGDMFDTETPSDRAQRQALAVMAQAGDLQWWIIPGNHDSAAAEPLWAGMARHAPENVHLLLRPEPVEIEAGAYLLPAPCLHRFVAQDPTRWMDQCKTPQGALRIGLAHGGVLEFGSEETGAGVISPQRAVEAELDYLALGDWHGGFTLDARTRYSGSPEADRFKHQGRGEVLLVTVSGGGAEPQIESLPVGQFDWQDTALEVVPNADVTAQMRALLPSDRRDWPKTLLRLRAQGWITAEQRLALAREVSDLAPEFCHFEYDETALRSEHRIEDLDLIASGGALRAAAQDLMAQSQNTDLAQQERAVATAALNRLYAYCQEQTAPEGQVSESKE